MKLYRKRGLTRAEPWTIDTNMHNVSISAEDSAAGSPKIGDMIAHDQTNDSRWLISKAYFDKNYEESK
jgi:hypothetical protein